MPLFVSHLPPPPPTSRTVKLRGAGTVSAVFAPGPTAGYIMMLSKYYMKVLNIK